MTKEANSSANDFDTKADAFFSGMEKETPNQTSAGDETNGDNTQEANTESGADQTKNANQVSDKSVKIPAEEKLAKFKEIFDKEIGEDKDALAAYLKQEGFHKHPAWQKILAKTKEVSANDTQGLTKEEIEQFKKVTSSPEWIRFSMKEEGFKDEAINSKLKELGHRVDDPTTDIGDFTMKALGIKPQHYATQEDFERSEALIRDTAKIAETVAKRLLEQQLGSQLNPIQEKLQSFEQHESASKMTKDMRNMIAQDGILDFDKEIEPELNKFIDENEGKITQADIFEFFKDLRTKLSIDKLKTKGKKEERDNKNPNLRSGSKTSSVNPGMLPDKTGDFDKDANAFLDAMGIKS